LKITSETVLEGGLITPTNT